MIPETTSTDLTFNSIPALNVSNLFNDLNLTDFNLTQLLDLLQNNYFFTDSNKNNILPTSLLTDFDLSSCLSNCSNKGLCKLVNTSFNCFCPPDFTGPKCQTDLRPCQMRTQCSFGALRCENILNGTQMTAHNLPYQNIYSGFKCICKSDLY